jgi:hypothetical protein
VIEITITHLSGARRGAVETFSGLPLRLGRAPECEVKFDPDSDLKVSATHAELRSDGAGGLAVADLASTNGVLVNGAKIEGQAPVPNHAVVELGVDGPRLQIKVETGSGGISFSKLKLKADTPPPMARPHLRTTDESPAYSETDLEPTQPTPPRRTGVNPGIVIAAVAFGAAALLLLFLFTRS